MRVRACVCRGRECLSAWGEETQSKGGIGEVDIDRLREYHTSRARLKVNDAVPYLSDASERRRFRQCSMPWCFFRVGRCRNEWIGTTGHRAKALVLRVGVGGQKQDKKKKGPRRSAKKAGGRHRGVSLWHWTGKLLKTLTTVGAVVGTFGTASPLKSPGGKLVREKLREGRPLDPRRWLPFQSTFLV